MYLMIQNPGEADVRAFTTLGLSTGRGQKESIGQFGSGAKHGILTCLRQGINPYIYCGTERIQFFTKPNMMNGTKYNAVFVKTGQLAARELSFCLEFGELDWTALHMGLREFVSNAIDSCDDIDDVTLDIVEKPRAKSGYTRVFIPLTPDVQQFYNSIQERFLQFQAMEHTQIMPKLGKEPSPARLYRKGVWIRDIQQYGNSLFDYNLGEELPIDESRNLDDYSARSHMATALCNDKSALETLFNGFVNGTVNPDTMECKFSYFQLNLMQHSDIVDTWKRIAGNRVIATPELVTVLGDTIQRRGYQIVVVPNGWFQEMDRAKIPTVKQCLSHVENNGCSVVEPTEKTIETLNFAWEILNDCGMTMGKEKPPCKSFNRPTTGETNLCGYYEDGCVYILMEHENNLQTMLEELAHYITGSTDNSRDFQEFAFRMAATLANIIYT